MKASQFFVIAAMVLVCNISHGQLERSISGQFDLASPRSGEPRYYLMEIDRTDRTVAGEVSARGGTRLWIQYLPDSGEWVCQRFEVIRGDDPAIRVRAVEGFRYAYAPGHDADGQVFGLDHAKFDNLTDEHGKPLSVIEHYWVYNTFIDFYSFTEYFVTKPTLGRGIQDLHRVGDRVVHVASNSSPPVNLNDDIQAGSTFTNGEIVLTFNGIGLANNQACALVGIDSGDSSLDMNMKPAPGVDVHVVGYSRYTGQYSINLQTRWLERFVGQEFVSTEMTGHTPAGDMAKSSVTTVQRRITSISEKDFNVGC